MKELLKDSDTFNEFELKNKKLTIIENEVINFNHNIQRDIEKIINSIPNNLSLIEKIRYIYINLGKLFYYDYRVAYDFYFSYKEVDFNSYIDQYETCTQISKILNTIFNNLNGVKSEIISRKIDNLRGVYGHDHVANKIIITEDNNEIKTYLLDLTLDLYLIQSGCKTKHFGFETSIDDNYDIIPQIDNKEMDNKLKLLKDNKYMDDIINSLKEKFQNINLNTFEEIINYKLLVINKLITKNIGYHEGKQFINLLFRELLNYSYKEFNIYKKDENDNIVNFKTIFKIESNNYSKWLIYSSNYGLMEIDNTLIEHLLLNGWNTKSSMLEDELFNKRDVK